MEEGPRVVPSLGCGLGFSKQAEQAIGSKPVTALFHGLVSVPVPWLLSVMDYHMEEQAKYKINTSLSNLPLVMVFHHSNSNFNIGIY